MLELKNNKYKSLYDFDIDLICELTNLSKKELDKIQNEKIDI